MKKGKRIMQFRCNTKKLAEALSVTGRAVSTKSSMPAMEGILIRTDNNQITLHAYNLELGISTAIDAECQTDGEIVLNAKIFTDMVRKLPGETVEVKSNEKLLTIVTSGAAEFTILGIPALEFPELPVFSDGTSIELPENLLMSMIRQTIFSISTDESNPIHTGILFELQDKVLRLVAVDGFRLAIRKEQVKEEQNTSFVVPGKTLTEIYKLLHPENDDPITINIGKKHLLFETGGYTIISRLLEGQFLDYKSVLSGTKTAEARVNARTLTNSIDRASLLITDRLKSPVRCIFEPDRIRIKCSSSIGKIYDEVNAIFDGEPCEMGFNNRYLIDALKATDCDEIRIQLGGSLSPMKICPPDGDAFIFLVLPVRLNADG
ncbi:MAG: DNA polymerase III subunit beta [Ethanoligenens sp.]